MVSGAKPVNRALAGGTVPVVGTKARYLIAVQHKMLAGKFRKRKSKPAGRSDDPNRHLHAIGFTPTCSAMADIKYLIRSLRRAEVKNLGADFTRGSVVSPARMIRAKGRRREDRVPLKSARGIRGKKRQQLFRTVFTRMSVALSLGP